MTSKPKSQTPYVMSVAEIAAVKEGQADMAAGRFMSEAQFRKRMSQYIKSREAKIGKKRPAC